MDVQKLYALLLIILMLTFVSCGTLEKSFISLNNHDYYTAFNGFNNGLKKDSSACAFGLSLYYDSPVTRDIDSSLKYILISETHWKEVSSKKRLSLLDYHFDSTWIQEQKQKLGDEMFLRYKSKLSYIDLDLFIEQHQWSRKLEEAYKLRDSLVLEQVYLNESVGFALDMAQKYPNSIYISELKMAIDLYEYQNFVKSFNEGDLTWFIETYPNNSHVGIVEDSIYAIYERNSGYKIMEEFIEAHSANRNIGKAWKELYRRYTENFKPELILQFEKEYTEYPFKDQITIDSELLKIEYYPFSDSSGLFGYTDSIGKWLIEPTYDDAGFFYNGIAGVEQNGKLGLINKKNEQIVDFIFDEIETDKELFVVSSNDHLGIINRNGDFIFDTIFEDISILDEGFICAQKDSLYAFYDRNGKPLTQEVYDDVLNFKNGVCPVSINGQKGLLNKDMKLLIPCMYEGIYIYSDSTFITINKDELRQLRNANGKIINDSLFQEIHPLVNGFAICTKDNRIGYLNHKGVQKIGNMYEAFIDYDILGNFNNGRAVVSKGKKFGIIDTTGQFVLKPSHDFIKSLGRYYGIQKKDKWTLINSSFETISDNDFESINMLRNKSLLIENDGRYGVMDQELNVIIQCLYASISEIDDFLIISGEEGDALFDYSGSEIIPFGNWSFYNADQNHLVVVNAKTGVIYKYIEKEGLRVINRP